MLFKDREEVNLSMPAVHDNNSASEQGYLRKLFS